VFATSFVYDLPNEPKPQARLRVANNIIKEKSHVGWRTNDSPGFICLTGYAHPGKLFQLMSKDQLQVLVENTARNMGDAPEFIKIRHIQNCLKADPAYGQGVAMALGISMDKVK